MSEKRVTKTLEPKFDKTPFNLQFRSGANPPTGNKAGGRLRIMSDYVTDSINPAPKSTKESIEERINKKLLENMNSHLETLVKIKNTELKMASEYFDNNKKILSLMKGVLESEKLYMRGE
mmetsp:Transcript_1906/g.1786  ORF Transcript_1906/g.1786 Transcript_1906/m.1786 type:complete len:120 (+) Transcript_1906:172-531(+)